MRIGLMPLYVALYDEKMPGLRVRLEGFYNEIAGLLEGRGVAVERAAFCRIRPEFEQTVAAFEKKRVDAIVTLHMAYSPSLESYGALTGTALPLIVFDTTRTEDFSDAQNPEEILYNHGIHGVMDLCSLLKRHNKRFAVCAGHYRDEAVTDRLCGLIRAASCANALKGSAVGLVGGYFEGMGDFQVSEQALKDAFGIRVVHAEREEMLALSARVTPSEVDAEIENDFKTGRALSEFPRQAHRISAAADLTLRKWIERKKVRAVAVNFQTVTEIGLPTMPFREACRAMSRGVGYAGEGDVLTAAFVGALLSAYPQTSFVEIFCPDWKHDTLFLSHMGEMNYRIADGDIEWFEKPFVFGGGANPIVGTAAFQPGEAVFLNIVPSQNGFAVFLAPVTMQKERTSRFSGEIRGWMKPRVRVPEFLERLSMAGATHHSVLVYRTTVEQMSFFAQCLGVEGITVV